LSTLFQLWRFENSLGHFTGWLAEARLSLCFTTYQAGKLFFLGLNRDGRLSPARPIKATTGSMCRAWDGRPGI
jgi:hypothetical protein